MIEHSLRPTWNFKGHLFSVAFFFAYIEQSGGILKVYSETAFLKQGYFCYFSNSGGIFTNRSLLPNFRIVKTPAPSVRDNKVLIY